VTVENWPAFPDDYPTLDDVGAILRARTQDDHDDELGTFTDDTRPTADEVNKLIAQAGLPVYTATGRLDDLTCSMKDQVQESAKYWVAMLTAMLIELTYFPEQVRSDRSAYAFYKEMWDDEITGFSSLIDAVKECREGELEPDTPGEEGGTPPDPSWAFPEDVGGMVGWQTRF
jgi:hypothetical protein